MTFTNIQIALDDLPTLDQIVFHDLEPAYARLQLLVAIAIDLVVLAGVGTLALVIQKPADFEGIPGFAWVALVAGLALISAYTFLAARAKGYAIREHDLVFRSGLFWRKEVVQPIRRIQHVELTRGPLEKRLGLANLKLFSAGSGKATFMIPGLSLLRAARTRRFVLKRERS